MEKLLICFIFLMPLQLKSAAHAEPVPDASDHTKKEYHEFYILNVSSNKGFFVRLREDAPPYKALRSSNKDFKEIYELPPHTSIKVLYTLKENERLRLRVWPHTERSFSQLRDKKCEFYAFKGKTLKAGANILLFTYHPEWQETNASKDLRKHKYKIGRSHIDKQPDTHADEPLCVISTECDDIDTFKQDLAKIIKQSDTSKEPKSPAPFATVHELKIPEDGCYTLSPFDDY